jgi:SAM-dependent methyltransferase
MEAEPAGDHAREAYDAYARWYDEFNSGYQYERWTGTLLAAANREGLSGTNLLDVGCGTGLSFLPMLDRGWDVTACDISPAMVDLARAKAGNRAQVLTADMRDLPALGSFDLVWAVNDAMNYLLSRTELEAALEGMRRNLAPEGLVVFDLNTLESYRTFFSEEITAFAAGRELIWRGLGSGRSVVPGDEVEASFEAKGVPASSHLHRQLHFPAAEVLAAVQDSGLSCLEVLGELEGELSEPLDEDRHSKAVYVCRRG